MNARDLGGLPRQSGALTPRGVFFRSENVDWVAPAGWDQMRDAGISTIVDLRQAGERVQDTQPRPDWIEALCQTYGTTTEGAFRQALLGLDLVALLASPGLNDINRAAVTSWRGSV